MRRSQFDFKAKDKSFIAKQTVSVRYNILIFWPALPLLKKRRYLNLKCTCVIICVCVPVHVWRVLA